jgi:hypothetical protein
MKRWITTIAIIAFCSSVLHADVTVTSTMTVEGAAPGMAGPAKNPRMVMRIKGLKARADVETNGVTQTSITDLVAKQMVVLQHGQKTAQVYGTAGPAVSAMPKFKMPKIDASTKPTGRSRTISGAQCDEYAVTMAMNMADFSGAPGMGPEAAEMLKDVRMVIDGSMWIAKSGPGVSDFVAFQRAATEGNMAAAFGVVVPGQQAGGIDRLLKALSGTPGLPYLTELQLKVEGSGPMVDAMKQMGGMKVRNSVTSVSTEPISDDQFQIPADYKVVKQ